MTLQLADPRNLSHDALEEGAVFAPRFDAQGLITAVAQEESGRVLMVAHMNAEALRLTVETGEVHYYSRSRGRIWKKARPPAKCSGSSSSRPIATRMRCC